MPELPEVETVKNQLKKIILNKKIIKVEFLHEKIFNGAIKDIEEALINNEIIEIERYGKYLVFILKDKYNLISHLRMEGKYHYRKDSSDILKHEHVIFYFNDGSTLRYHDTRKFGRMDLRLKEEYLLVDPLHKLGKEPKDMLSGELYEILKNKNVLIKPALLDQTVISGIGNIYADEVLFMSRVHPERNTQTITKAEADLMTESAKIVFEKAIKLGGTTIKSFSATEIDGLFQNELLVHTKENELCPVCSNIIIKTKVRGRGTYICEKCQK